MFLNKLKKDKVPVSYEINHPNEIVELFAKSNLHYQAALLRLISRNLVIDIDGKKTMGYEMDFEVDGAMITAVNETQSEVSD